MPMCDVTQEEKLLRELTVMEKEIAVLIRKYQQDSRKYQEYLKVDQVREAILRSKRAIRQVIINEQERVA